MTKRLLVLLLWASPCLGQAWSGIIDPTRANPSWPSAGAVIVNRTGAPCATLGTPGQVSSFAQSVTTAQINAAILACNNGIVLLNPGTYTANFSFGTKSNVTLRGSGANQTLFAPTGTIGCANASGTALFCVGGDGQWSGQPDHLTNWTAGYAQGTTIITLASVAGLSVGQVLILDQLDDAADTGNIYICGTLAATCSSEGQAGSGGRGGNHGQMQFAPVTAINGNQVTIARGLYMPNWRSGQSPAAWWATTLAQNDGIEDIGISVGVTNPGFTTVFINAYNCWVKGVSQVGTASRAHVEIDYSSNVTVRDSYFYGAAGSNLSYGLESWDSGNLLYENNIFQHVTSPILMAPTEGTVVAYNFAIDSFTCAPPNCDQQWMFPTAMDHDVGTSMNLFEGNIFPSFMQDAIHGSHGMETYFRNRAVGRDTANTTHIKQNSGLMLESFSRYTNFIGNVLGTSGWNNRYQVDSGSTTTNCDTSIYNLGWGGTQCTNGSPAVNADPFTATSLMRWGNYDVVNAAVQWNFAEVPTGLPIYANAVPATHNLPASFYLASAPLWWPSGKPFPPIGPDVTGGNVPNVGGFAYTIPAQDCFTNIMGGSLTVAGAALPFNASTCYSVSAPTVGLNPVSLSFGSVIVGNTTSSSTVTLTNTGAGSLTIFSIVLSGASAADFNISSNTCGASLAASANCVVSVTLRPSAVGARSANLVFTTNASTSPDTASLSGTGVSTFTITGKGTITGSAQIKINP